MDQSLQVLWEDGERVLFRGSRLGPEGERKSVLTVLLSADRPPPWHSNGSHTNMS